MQRNGSKEQKVAEEVAAVKEIMESIVSDTGVPRNIRKAVDDSKIKLDGTDEIAHKISSAIYLLDDISNDINMPSHTRTDIWQIISELESIREKAK